MRAGSVLQILAVNAILLLGVYFVTLDLAARSAHAAAKGMSYSFAQGLLVEVSNLSGPSGTLQSPLMLSWLQVLLGAVLIIDVLFVYGWTRRKRLRSSQAPGRSPL